MADYQRMYSTLFNAMSDAISTLQKAQQTAEEIYLSGDDAVIYIIEQIENSNKCGDRE